MLENLVFDEIAVGARASLARVLTREDIDLFAIVSGDLNPTHFDADTASPDKSGRVVAHSTWATALVSGVVGTKLPGPGAVYASQSLRFHAPIGLGDRITAEVVVREKHPQTQTIDLDIACTNQDAALVLDGSAIVHAPRKKFSGRRSVLPDVSLSYHARFRMLLARAAGHPPVTLAVAHPCDVASITGVAEIAALGLVTPILVGPTAKIQNAAGEAGVDISAYRLVDTPHSHAAAAAAVALVRAGEAALLMKGALHTDELMHEVVQSATGLRTARRLSHAFVMDVPHYPRLLFITDAAINITPSLEDKRDITQSAIDLAQTLGIATPRVAILCAVETVNPAMQATLDAAALCKMADRGQITGGLLDGPLALDNAVSELAASQKGIVSEVAGRADILVVPDLEAGNMLAKQLSFLAGADAAGVVLGASVPIILTSRADSQRSRVASCIVAVLLAQARQVA
jgi:phosphotransacetylase/acyl dehydratase